MKDENLNQYKSLNKKLNNETIKLKILKEDLQVVKSKASKNILKSYIDRQEEFMHDLEELIETTRKG